MINPYELKVSIERLNSDVVNKRFLNLEQRSDVSLVLEALTIKHNRLAFLDKQRQKANTPGTVLIQIHCKTDEPLEETIDYWMEKEITK